MMLLIDTTADALRRWDAEYPGAVGGLVGPGRSLRPRVLRARIPYAADNACYGGLRVGPYLRMLSALSDSMQRPLWVTAPDVVGDAGATLDLWRVWGPVIRAAGLPVCFVGQDGLTETSMPWPLPDAYFVGGSDQWRWGAVSEALVRAVKAHGRRVHMGRVTTQSGVITAARWGVDTIDTTGASRYSEDRVPQLLGWIRKGVALARHPRLFS